MRWTCAKFTTWCRTRAVPLFAVRRADIEAFITRKGGKVVTIPLAPRTARAIDLAVSERTDGPVFVTADGRRLDRHGASRIVRRVARRADASSHSASASRTAAKRERIRASAVFGHGCSCMS